MHTPYTFIRTCLPLYTHKHTSHAHSHTHKHTSHAHTHTQAHLSRPLTHTTTPITPTHTHTVRTDVTPPATGTVSDGPFPSRDIQFSSSQTTVKATWNGIEDYESGIETYTVTIFRRSLGSSVSQILHRESISGNTDEISWNFFSLFNGDFVTVEVEAINGAGLTSTQVSDGVIVDLTAPTLIYIVDGISSMQDESFQSNTDNLQVAWNVTDYESGLSLIKGTIFEITGSRRVPIYGSNDIMDTVPVTNVGTLSINDLQLVSGLKYVISLTFTNGADVQSVFETSGITVDTSPPIIETVSITSDTYAATNAIDTISERIVARWYGMDPESGIAHYLVGIVNENSTSVVPNETFSGSLFGGIIDNFFSLTPSPEEYRLMVVAVNNAGWSSAPSYSTPFRLAESLV